MDIPIIENVLKHNDELARMNRQALAQAGVLALDLIGAPGCGKTALIEATLSKLPRHIRVGVIAGDLATRRDADRIAHWCPQVVQVNTGKGCHLDANQVRQALSRFDLDALDLLFIENVGNLICPVGFDLGQDFKVGIFSLCEGDDKAAKHPYIVHESALLLLNKLDLAPYIPFNLENFRADVQQLQPGVRLLELSVLGQDPGLGQWLAWLQEKLASKNS